MTFSKYKYEKKTTSIKNIKLRVKLKVFNKTVL